MKRLSLRNHHSSLLLVVQILVLLIGALFFAGGCPNEPTETRETAEAAFKKFTGKWRVAYSSDSQDSSFINSAWIDLRADSTFSSNTSFFWREYALNIQPLQGRWLTMRQTGESGSAMLIELVIEPSYKFWQIDGNGKQDSTMTWSDRSTSAVQYRWKIY
ncbi:MAG: hypothetical protein HYV29_15255 [Ignavibacteriales bacterium]|nr:hypothetical protein [Ignavibacteriales bacterium]